MSDPQGFDEWFGDGWREGKVTFEAAPGIFFTYDANEFEEMIAEASKNYAITFAPGKNDTSANND